MRKPSKAVAILKWKLKRGKEPTLENILAVLADTRKLAIPPEFRRPPKEPARIAPVASVDDFEKNVLLEAVGELQAELQAVRQVHEQELTDMALDAYHRAAQAAAEDPDNAELAAAVKKMRKLLEQAFGGAIPPRNSDT
jgi:hypothetical protein